MEEKEMDLHFICLNYRLFPQVVLWSHILLGFLKDWRIEYTQKQAYTYCYSGSMKYEFLYSLDMRYGKVE